ncbi:MAG: DUF2147 domain-containing protein [Bradyrhizobium sp.]|nr:DUF2147 domain-containing protein [Bradyrhizobium sp.]
MKRFFYLVVLIALSSPAQAGNSFSFAVAGRRITIEAPRDCNSPSCVSVSIPGIYETRGGRDRNDDIGDASDAAAPAKPPAATQQQVSTPTIVPPASKPAVEPVASAPAPPALTQVAATVAPATAVPLPSRVQPANPLPKTPQPKPLPATAAADKATPTVPPAPAPHPVQVLQETDDDPSDAPLGDWQTEGNKGSVRIERCGQALCGYILNASSDTNGETVLINMKPKTASEWSGNIYSRDSGSTYYATIAMKGPDSLRVEACALGRFFCSGNVWSRVGAKQEKRVTSRRTLWVPRS